MTNYKKRRKKDQRRARKMSEQAWQAADDGELSTALKIIRRATDLAPANPVVWNDQGLLSLEAADEDGAVTSVESGVAARHRGRPVASKPGVQGPLLSATPNPAHTRAPGSYNRDLRRIAGIRRW